MKAWHETSQKFIGRPRALLRALSALTSSALGLRRPQAESALPLIFDDRLTVSHDEDTRHHDRSWRHQRPRSSGWLPGGPSKPCVATGHGLRRKRWCSHLLEEPRAGPRAAGDTRPCVSVQTGGTSAASTASPWHSTAALIRLLSGVASPRRAAMRQAATAADGSMAARLRRCSQATRARPGAWERPGVRRRQGS
jgi:hypothetical protein